MSFKSAAVLLGAFAASVVAHGTVTGFTADGVAGKGYALENYYKKQQGQAVDKLAAWSAENLDNGFVGPQDYATADINCHKNAAPGVETATVAAGGEVEFQWSDWPDSHAGPVFTYVAKCAASCADADVSTLKWVKIDEGGYDVSAKKWAATKLIENDDKWVTKVPSTLAAGNYVFRHEIIAMHGAGDLNGAQNYPQCFNIKITGSGTENPTGTLGKDLYKATDAGIKFNPYAEITNYEIPGPALYGAGSGGDSPAPVPTSTPVPTAPSGGNGTAPIASTVAPAPSATGIVTSILAPTNTAGADPVATQPASGGDNTDVVSPPAATGVPSCGKRRRSLRARRHARALRL